MKGEAGFTLIEAVLAASLISLGLLLFIHGAAVTARLHARSRLASSALLLAQERMEMLASRGWDGMVADCAAASGAGCEIDERGRLSGVVGMGPARYRVSLEKSSVAPRRERFTVTCHWDGEGSGFSRERSVRLATERRKDR